MVNSVYFSSDQFKNGEMDKFIHHLNELSYGKSDQMIQVLIIPVDCGAYEVQFIQVPWDHSYGGKFKYDEEIE